MTLGELIRRRSGDIAAPDQVKFLTVDEHGTFFEEDRSYAQILERGSRFARFLTTQRVGYGENIALLLENVPEFAEVMTGAAMIGAPFVPIEPRMNGEALRFLLDYSDCLGVVCSSTAVASLVAVLPGCKKIRWVVVVGGGDLPDVPGKVLHYDDLMAAGNCPEPCPASGPEPVESSPMLIMFTSGSTGDPKGVVLTHGDMLSGVSHLDEGVFGKADKFYTGLSLTHIHGLITLLNSIVLGLPVVISRKFTLSRLWEICRRYQCTVFNALGGMFTAIYGVPPRPDDADNPVRIVHSSGMPADLWEPFCKRFGVQLLEGYGSTEGGLLVNVLGEGPVGSIGRPPAHLEAAILDEQMNPMGPGEVGEICFRRRDRVAMRVQYLNQPQASAEKTRGGWLHMGDLGHYDAEGWFYFHHRAGRALRKSGEFINPAVIEVAVARHPDVADVFVYGVRMQGNVAGERTIVAAIVPRRPDDFSRDSLLSFCRGILRRNEVPDIVQVLAEIPKSASQKPIERECMALLGRG